MKKESPVNWEELIVSNMIQLEALTNILIRKKITDDNEYLLEIKSIREQMEKKLRDSTKMN
ncbi:MAG: hypothetical protein QY331_07550 [Melioribacteraceae bacterium]|nr:MAG: hypothetical protein QY331_07550 [Melioribacteraceae bacterium]